MLSPKRIKFRKQQRNVSKGAAHRGNTIAFGEYALLALQPKWITNRQIEAARIAMTRHIKRGGKGAPEGWVAVVKEGTVMFEMGGVSEELAREALTLAGSKLPIKTKFVARREVE